MIYKLKETFRVWEQFSNIWNKIFFDGWSLACKNQSQSLTIDDLKYYQIRPDEKQTYNQWEYIKKSSGESVPTSTKLLKFLFKLQWKRMLVIFLLSFIMKIGAFYQPIALENLLSIAEIGTNQDKNYYQFIFFYVMFKIGMSILSEISSTIRQEFNIKLSNCGKTILYQKIVNLSSSSKKYLGPGVLNSYYNQDCGSIGSFFFQVFSLILCPFSIVFGTYRLSNEIGNFAYFGPLVVCLTLLSQNLKRKKIKNLEKEKSKLSDKKSKAINESISGMKVLKYNGWEEIYKNKILKIRESEIELKNEIHRQNQLGSLLINGIPQLYILAVFIYFSFTDNPITLTKLLVINSIFSILKGPFSQIYSNINTYSRVMISLTKIANFLDSEEKVVQNHENEINTGEILMQGCKLQYENRRVRMEENKRRQLKEELSQLNKVENSTKQQLLNLQEEIPTVLEVQGLKIQKGELIGVIGKVGSGKSSFGLSILGQINMSEGICFTQGRIAYCPQTAWLKNASIHENILYGEEYDENKYDEVLHRCQLEDDLSLLQHGDETLVGEKGVKLSGGQKQRISIARCLYHDSDIYIFDDCLSALDAHVGKNIFDNVIKYLHGKGKTIIFILNAIEYLKYCDRTIFVEQGKIKVYSDLNELKNLDSIFMENIDSKPQKSQQPTNLDEANVFDQVMLTKKEKRKKKQIIKEQQQHFSIIKSLIRFVVENFEIQHGFVIVLLLANELSDTFYKWWLGSWTKNNDDNYTIFYAVGAIAIYFGKATISFQRSTHTKNIGFLAGNKLHSRYLQMLFKTPLSWFDSKPIGEILDRASKYQNRVDNDIIQSINQFLSIIASFLIALLMVIGQTPMNSILIFGMFFIFYKINKLVEKPAKDITDMMNSSTQKRSSFLQETVTGTYLIRSLQKVDRYRMLHSEHIKRITKIKQNSRYIRGSFMTILMTMTSNIIVASICFFIVKNVQMRTEPMTSNESVWIGLTINSSMKIGKLISRIFRNRIALTDLCSSLNKIYQWILENPSQKSFIEPVPEDNWLESGQLQVNNASYRYRSDLPIVLSNISFSVKKHEKIGIAGRTGSGKSTFTLGMLRILQLCQDNSNQKGYITIDKTNISEIGLHFLRHEIAMIPQDPFLFSGTLKSNIDPFEKYSDEEIVESLKKAHIWQDLKETKDEQDPIQKKLNSKMNEEGSNYSVGQRQLICLARALVRNPKILLMDEATASIDMKTDQLIQEMMSTEFKNTTVISIAHRLNTIINYDKILVLDQGEVKEFDSPLSLITNPDSFLGQTIRKVGQQYTERMINLAKKNNDLME